jgi:hypothetical protein
MESVEYEGAMDTQGGGHGRIRKCKVIPGGQAAISKPLDHREGDAYRSIQDTPLKSVTPTFFGIHNGCLIISDLTEGFSSPCLADFKVGKRHSDPDAPAEKVQGLIEKQKGSTTDSLGVRLIDAKIRKANGVVKEWDRKQGLKFTPDELENIIHEFIPADLKDEFQAALYRIWGTFSDTVGQYPGFRMYASSVLVAYDGDAPTEIRVVLIDFAHTHMSIDKEGFDREDAQYDDGVLDGITSLINFIQAHSTGVRGAISFTEVAAPDGTAPHKRLKRAVLNTGEKVILRHASDGEVAAYTLLSGTEIAKKMPMFYGHQDGLLIVEDITVDFAAPCIIDFQLSGSGKAPKSTKQPTGVRFLGGYLSRNGKPVKKWLKSEASHFTNRQMAEVYQEFVPSAKAEAVSALIQSVKEAYEATVKDAPGFRMCGASLLIAYDGDNNKKAPKVVLNRFKHLYLDITNEGFDVNACPDGFLEGILLIQAFAAMTPSRCCLLL